MKLLRLPLLATLLFCVPLDIVSGQTDAISNAAATPRAAATKSGRAASEPLATSERLRFNFTAANWSEVLQWFSDQADLSLQPDPVPSGTFTFSDPSRAYTISEALDVLNLSLIKRGFILVRRGRMLQVIDLEAENADKLISEIAELVRPEDLEQRGNSDIVSCIMPLGSLTPDAAREELAQVVGPWGRVVVLDSARQVKITETADKLIAIRDLLESAAMADTTVIEIILKHRSADELLELARPLLGLEPGQAASDEIRISVGLYGDRIYAAGLPAKTGLLKSLIEKADQPLAMPDSDSSEAAAPLLQTHPVATADSTTVFDVLQTLLAGTPDARLSIDPKTGAMIAWARPETHRMIAETIAKMEGRRQEFKVIDLRRLDPAQALMTINKFFGVTESGGDGPTVNGDPATGKLWVRGSAEQIALVEKLLAELEGADPAGTLGQKVRMLPYTGDEARSALSQVQQVWEITGRKNQIRIIAPSGKPQAEPGIPERRIPRRPQRQEPSPDPANEALHRKHLDSHPRRDHDVTAGHSSPRYHLVSQPAAEEEPASESHRDQPAATNQMIANIPVDGADIIVQVTPQGLMIASEDTAALDAFESLLASFAEPTTDQSDLPTIIWLKYIKADLAAELISSILGGGESSVASAVDSVTSGFGGGMLGLLGLGGGGGGEAEEPGSGATSLMTTTGTVNIVPDARLNALIVQAGPADMRLIEMILEKIDREESPEDIQTIGRPQLIPVIYQNAADVAEVVRAVFAERIEGDGGGKSDFRPPSPQEFLQALRGKGKGKQEKPSSQPAPISIAVDKKSNALVVVATPQDFQDVRELVETLDNEGMESEETIITHTMDGSVNPEVLRLALESILGTEAGTTSAESPSRQPVSSRGDDSKPESARAASDIQRRMEFFRALRDRMGSENDDRQDRGGDRQMTREQRRGANSGRRRGR